jgi:hypothetical protein
MFDERRKDMGRCPDCNGTKTRIVHGGGYHVCGGCHGTGHDHPQLVVCGGRVGEQKKYFPAPRICQKCGTHHETGYKGDICRKEIWV